jgi:hypothetical protein
MRSLAPKQSDSPPTVGRLGRSIAMMHRKIAKAAVFATLIPTVGTLAACGSGGSSVTGTVTWPDGHPAANASVFFHNYDPGFSASGWSKDDYNDAYQVQQLPADGSYSLPGCSCTDLTAYLYLRGTPGADPANGGQDCWIITQDENQTYSGRQANPSDVVSWPARDMPCSATWYTSDRQTVRSESTTVLPALNSGSWQSAETRTSGGSGG